MRLESRAQVRARVRKHLSLGLRAPGVQFKMCQVGCETALDGRSTVWASKREDYATCISCKPIGRQVAVRAGILDFAKPILTWLAAEYTLNSVRCRSRFAVGLHPHFIAFCILTGNKAR